METRQNNRLGFERRRSCRDRARACHSQSAGEVEEVKENALSLVFINAIKQEQKQIEAQLQQINALKQFICTDHRNLEVCKAN
jgi:hypothetical protein